MSEEENVVLYMRAAIELQRPGPVPGDLLMATFALTNPPVDYPTWKAKMDQYLGEEAEVEEELTGGREAALAADNLVKRGILRIERHKVMEESA
jgi:hypothetical protein